MTRRLQLVAVRAAFALLAALALPGEAAAQRAAADATTEQLATAALQATGSERVALLNRLAAHLEFRDAGASLRTALDAAREARAVGDRRGAMEALYRAGFAHRSLGAFTEALDASAAALRIARELGDEVWQAHAHDLLGLTLFRMGELGEALAAHLDAFAIREDLGDRRGLAFSYNNLANVYRRMGELDQAMEHHRRSLELKVELGDRAAEGYSHENLGDVYREMGRHEEALAAYERARRIREDAGDLGGLASLLIGVGMVREAQGNPSRALDGYQQALDLWRQAGDPHGEAVALLNIGRARVALGDDQAARDPLVAALARFEEIGARRRAAETLDSLADLAQAQGRPAEALEHLRRRLAFEIEGRRTDVAARLAEVRRERVRAAELLQRRRERNALVAIAALLLLLCAAMLYAYRLRRDSERRFREKAEALARSIAETRVLRGMLPICAGCKKIRDDVGYWNQIEEFIREHSEAEFTHGMCPACIAEHYPDYAEAPVAAAEPPAPVSR